MTPTNEGPLGAADRTLTRLGLADTLYRLREPFTHRKSWPDGKRWSVLDGSGFDDDVFDMFDTEAEAAAAVQVANKMREDALLIAATLDARHAALVRKPNMTTPEPRLHFHTLDCVGTDCHDPNVLATLDDLDARHAALVVAARLPRNTRVSCDHYEGEWIAVPAADFVALRDALAALEVKP
jgi:hypothetical protein